MHGLIFAGKLTGVPVKTIPTEGATNGAASLTPVQDLWENSFKKIGDENPEQTVTGMLLFYPHQLVGYLEASEITYKYGTSCTANVYRDLQGLCGGFSAISAGKTL